MKTRHFSHISFRSFCQAVWFMGLVLLNGVVIESAFSQSAVSPAGYSQHSNLPLYDSSSPNASSPNFAASVQLQPFQGYLLLKNGQAIQGKITKSGDDYFVSLTDGQIRLHVRQVELVCKSLLEGYEIKATRVAYGNLNGHLDLFDWCIRHRLTPQAAIQMKLVRMLDPSHPKLKLLERQYQLAVQPQVSSEIESPKTPRKTEMDSLELEKLVKSMPTGGVVSFTQKIQPLLVNSCSVSSCHGQQSTSDWKLHRIPVDRQPSLRLTQRNLYSTLQMISRTDSEKSPLLKYSIENHGQTRKSPFGDANSWKYQQLLHWAQQMAPYAPELPAVSETEKQTQTAEANPTSIIQPVAHSEPLPQVKLTGVRAFPNGNHPQSVRTKTMNGQTEPIQEELSQIDLSRDKRLKRAVIPQGFQPKDPFDPEIFNRQYSGK